MPVLHSFHLSRSRFEHQRCHKALLAWQLPETKLLSHLVLQHCSATSLARGTFNGAPQKKARRSPICTARRDHHANGKKGTSVRHCGKFAASEKRKSQQRKRRFGEVEGQKPASFAEPLSVSIVVGQARLCMSLWVPNQCNKACDPTSLSK